MTPFELLRQCLALLLVFGILSSGVAEESGRFPDDMFDFIIVGGGTAGCVLANRLSENRKSSVLVLEAGQLPDPNLEIPALSPHYTFGPNQNHIKSFRSVPQEFAGKSKNGIISYPVGWTLGGGSSVNMMFFNRGSAHDYDNWANKTGDDSWSYENLLKYFKKMEDYHGDFPEDSAHGFGGPITVSRPRYAPGLEQWLEAGKQLGYDTFEDPNGPQQIGFTSVEFSKKFGRRVSSNNAYIRPVNGTRPNLKLVLGAKVNRIVFVGNRAVGVIYTRGNAINFAPVRKEIILTAGAIESPTILMRSGVGPREVLEEARITPVKYLPVGRNLKDHIQAKIVALVNKSVVFDEERDLNEENWEVYNAIGDGPYSAAGGAAQAFLRAPRSPGVDEEEGTAGESWANVHLILLFGGLNNPMFKIRDDIQVDESEGPIYLAVFFTRPRSAGYLKLNASNVDGDPIIDFKYLTDPQDMEDILWGVKKGLEVIEKTPAFQGINARLSNPLKACEHLLEESDDSYWRCYVEQTSSSGAHAGGTCKMGGSQDPDAVVDTTLRVIGIPNVRVADLSIKPDVVNANTQVAAYVIAEKAADMILQSHTFND